MVLILRIAFSVGLVALLLWRADAGDVLAHLGGLAPWAGVGALALFATAQCIGGLRWRIVLESGGDPAPRVPYLTGLLFVGMFFNFFLPSTVGGDVARAEVVQARLASRVDAYAGVLFDRFVAFLTVVVIGMAAVIGGRIAYGWDDPDVLWLSAALFVLGVGALVALRAPAAERLLRLPLGWLPDSVSNPLHRAFDALRSYAARGPMLVRVLGLAFLVQLVGTIGPIWVLSLGLGLDVPAAFHFVAVPLVIVVTLLPVSFNGVGLREGLYVHLYGKMGVDDDAAIALSLAWTLLMVVMAAFGGLLLLWRGAAWRRPHEDSAPPQ